MSKHQIHSHNLTAVKLQIKHGGEEIFFQLGISIYFIHIVSQVIKRMDTGQLMCLV